MNPIKQFKPALGSFIEKDYGHRFYYRKTNDPWALSKGYEYEVDVGYDTRFAKIKKTRCHMVLDEDKYGQPVVEVWQIRSHFQFEAI